MGKHSASGRRDNNKGRPRRIERLEPASTSAETTREQRRRELQPTQRERAARRHRGRRIVLWSLAALAVVIIAGAAVGFGYIKTVESRMNARVPEAVRDILDAAPKPVERDAPFNVLVLGSDKRPDEETARADTIIILRVDPQSQNLRMLSIPRDTRVDIPGHGKSKINAANALGGPELMIQTVTEFTGVPIHHYVEVDFNGFKDMVDAIGGVYVDVPEAINDLKASNYVESASVINSGYQQLDGAHALTFVRSREYPRGDLQRIENQQAFLRALMQQTLQIQNATKFNGIANAVADNVTTDLGLSKMLDLVGQMRDMSADAMEARTIPGEPKYIGGGSYVVPDEEELEKLVTEFNAGRSIEATTGTAVAPVPETIEVSVRNGAGRAGIAAYVASRLNRAGYDVVEVGNMSQFVYDETLVVYGSGGLEMAEAVADSLGVGRAVESRGLYAFNSDVLVVVGKDLPLTYPRRPGQLLR